MKEFHKYVSCLACIISIGMLPAEEEEYDPSIVEYLSRDYLMPVTFDYFDDYPLKLIRLMEKKVEGEIGASAIVRPSFTEEYGIFFTKKLNFDTRGHEYFIEIVKARKNVGQAMHHETSLVIDESFFSKQSITINHALYKRICDIWEKPIKEVSNSKLDAPQGLDGTRYEFSVFVIGAGYLRGEQWIGGNKPNILTVITDGILKNRDQLPPNFMESILDNATAAQEKK